MPTDTSPVPETEMLQASLLVLDHHVALAEDVVRRAETLTTEFRRGRDDLATYLDSIGALPDPSTRPHAPAAPDAPTQDPHE